MPVDYSESLSILGIRHSSSNEEIEQAYRDLMRVWHPDRFATDERLRQKAEEESKRINEAVNVVRAYRESGSAWNDARVHSHTTHPNSQQQRQTRNAATETKRETKRPETEASQPPAAAVLVYQRRSTSLLRCIAAGCSLFVGYRALLLFQGSSFEGAFASVVAFCSIFVLIREGFLLFTKLPVISATNRGLYLFGVGVLPWEQVAELLSLQKNRSIYLGVNASEDYVRKRGFYSG
jgi:hypothetical protein